MARSLFAIRNPLGLGLLLTTCCSSPPSSCVEDLQALSFRQACNANRTAWVADTELQVRRIMSS